MVAEVYDSAAESRYDLSLRVLVKVLNVTRQSYKAGEKRFVVIPLRKIVAMTTALAAS